MKVILFMATSINSIIATEDYSEDFLNGTWKYFVELGSKYGCVIWGRTTYQLVNKMPFKYTDSIKHIKKIVISSNPKFPLGPKSQLFLNPESALKGLKEQGYKKVILSGGSKINSSFAKSNLIDEVILLVDSIIVGKGIPLFSPENFQLKLKPLRTEIKDGHLVYTRYKVIKSNCMRPPIIALLGYLING